MLARFSTLNTRLAAVIGAILVIFLTADIWYSAKSSRDTAIHEVERWSVLLAETVRVSLNVLMKEEKMDARFGMYEAMTKEIPGLEKVRVIRGEKVNELFQAERERKAIPREQKVITGYRKDIEELSAKLRTTKSAYERKDIESEIADAQREIANAEKNIQELRRPIKSDQHELPSNQMDRQVLDSGKPLFIVEGDKLQVWSPYIAHKGCGSTGGCHVGVEDGTVLGAVNMEFSLVGVNQEIRRNAVFSTVGKIILSLLIIGCLMFMITRIILRQIGGEPDYASDVVRQVAEGNLTVQVKVRPGDTSSLLASLKGMVDRLSEIVGNVRGTTESIKTASREIAAGNADLSQRTEEQASSLEETASSMEELTSTVRQNAESARQANHLAANASDIAVKGGDVVGNVVHTMASISDSSKKIVDIISVIESIAFQTNILALNAAVEAARAGEQGRGFAVVAGEVRNLAQRSAAAAREIKALIDDSTGKVEVGSQQVAQAGTTMTEIVQAVKRVTDIMAEIAAASNEQNAGIEQVNQAITQMDEVTQQNAALVEEAAAAAEAMQEQAKALYEAVGIFRVPGGGETQPGFEARPASQQVPVVPQHAPALRATRKGRKLAGPSALSDGDWKEF
jgi:methyl-accepting chemotaxis protein